MNRLTDKHEIVKLAIGFGIVIISTMVFTSLIELSIQLLAPDETISTIFQSNQAIGLSVLILNHLGMFIIPAFIMQRLYSTSEESYISFENAPINKYGFAILILLGILFVSGLIVKGSEFIINQTPIKEWAYQLQNESTTALKSLLAKNENIGVLFLKILAISIIPAIGEELIFRGILIKNFYRMSKNKHIAILISSILFSLMHFQPYNFLAFILIGISFGYIYWRSQDIKITMLLHFLFNLSSLLMIEFGYIEM